SANGYLSKTFPVQIVDQQVTILDVQLYNGKLITNFVADSTLLAVDQTVNYSDQSAGNPTSWKWTFDGGTPASSVDKNPVITYQLPGKYAVKLVVTRTGASDSLVRTDYIEVKPWYIMSNKAYSVCDAQFFDAGGPNANYSGNENSVITFTPTETGRKLTALFNSIDIEEGGTNCSNDKLLVYNGTSTGSNLLATLCGSSLPSNIVATNPTGALTFQFISNSTVSKPGWDITLTCDSNVGITENIQNLIRVFPNPVIIGSTVVEANDPIQILLVKDVTGRTITSIFPNTNRTVVDCDWSSGIYILQMQVNGRWVSKKIQVLNN
ncbi:MAG: PKD domain-containing protein, partial [Bacteroidales bacterium]